VVSRPKGRPILGYRCLSCSKEFPWGRTLYGCPACGQNVEIVLDLAVLSKKVTRETFARSRLPGHWRFLPVLPLDTPPPVLERRSQPKSPLASVGGTPLYRSRGLEGQLGVGPIYLKDEGRNPSGSLKDRASSVALARALEEDARIVAAASTGNAGASLACMGASTGMPTVILVPRTAPRAKVAQLQTFGAKVLQIDANYDRCYDLCNALCKARGWFNRNTGLNPITREGNKTCAYEIAMDLGFEVPDLVLTGAGDGNILSGLAKGFLELHQLGLTKRVPKMVAVQSTSSNAIAQAFVDQRPITPVKATTIADSICVDYPRDGSGAMVALRRTEGFVVEVSDADIMDAIQLLGREEGVFAEPAAAAPVAGLRALVQQGRIRNDRSVALVITGTGLKDVDAAMRAARALPVVAPDLESVQAALAAFPEHRGR
jgi:threonine synthase